MSDKNDQYRIFYDSHMPSKAEHHAQNEEEAHEVVRLRVPVIYTAIKQEGEDELSRPVVSLWWSGLAAGFAIFFSVVASGALAAALEPGPLRQLLVPLGYTTGFLMVIIGRLQLFTENTITAVIPMLSHEHTDNVFSVARLWTIVFTANITGVFIATLATMYGGIFPASLMEGVLTISHHYIERSAYAFFAQAIPAGFIIAALVWMLPSSRGSEFWIILIMTYLIAMLELTHVIAGTGEVFIMLLKGHISLFDTVFVSILPTLAGNVLGGTALFTMLAHGQVKEEI